MNPTGLNTFINIARLEIEGELESLADCAFQLLSTFPNLEYLHINHEFGQVVITDFTKRLTTFLKNNPATGARLGVVRIGQKHKFDIDKVSKELRDSSI